MTLLVISPDFISHYSPLAVVARAAKQAGMRVIFATGTNMATHVEAEGFEWTLLQLSQGANSGICLLFTSDAADEQRCGDRA